ncbi:hypothetical protein M407DRAFT_26532 [Tulasnella calospora MUT 4182]|uniref:Ubiquitin-like protease family profile domain-containing protein n=1 Tax=Tulasnella calospora MUT 4182 TaxID=1051891 RepID=A0A0C3Q4W1_9AGAM|nr:hypothetical protein M407DRAFT_26532 [Tulasnella calospora MUT 4182]
MTTQLRQLPPSWTFFNSRPTPPTSGNRIPEAVEGDQVAELRFYGTSFPAAIQQEDLARLEPKQWLSDSLCTFYCYEVGNAYLKGAPGRAKDLVILHARTWHLGSWTHGFPKNVRVKGARPTLEHKYIVFPGNDSETHFFLCIIVFPFDLLLDLNPSGPVRTTALILNSIQQLPPFNPKEKLVSILIRLSEGRPLRENDLGRLKVLHPLMPQQPNSYDCGLYPGHFLSVFLSSPEAFTAHLLGEEIIEGAVDDIWKHSRIRDARQDLKDLVLASAEIQQAAFDFNTDVPLPVL